MENLAECQKPYIQQVNGDFGLQKMPLLKNGFLEKNEAWHVGLSCQYTHFTSFSSKSEHDTVADQATLNTNFPPQFFTIKSPSVTQRSVSQENAYKKS